MVRQGGFQLRDEEIVSLFVRRECSWQLRIETLQALEKAGVWAANEWSDDEAKTERLALSGDSKELTGKFKDAFEGATVLHAAAREVG